MEWLMCCLVVFGFVLYWISGDPEEFFELIFFKDVLSFGDVVLAIVMWLWISFGVFCLVMCL